MGGSETRWELPNLPGYNREALQSPKVKLHFDSRNVPQVHFFIPPTSKGASVKVVDEAQGELTCSCFCLTRSRHGQSRKA